MSSLVRQRRTRRRRQVAIFLTVAVLIAVIALAVRYRTEERETADYLAVVGEIAGDELTLAQGFRELFDGIADLERPDIIDRLGSLGTESEELATRLDGVVVTRSMAELHGFMTVALRSWTDGLAALGGGVIEVMDQPDDASETPDGFISALDMLRIGDSAYTGVLAASGRLDSDIAVPQLPQVTYVGGDDPLDVDNVVSKLRLRLSLSERRDVEVTANTAPEPTGDRAGMALMPFTPTFDVTAVVTNSGNVLQEEIEVTLRLERDGAEGEPFEERRIIAALDPATSVSVEFRSLDIAPSAVYTLDVSASITDDANTANNVWQIVFVTNAE